MKPRYHAIPSDLFGALGSGGGGPEAIGALAAAEASKHAILLRGVVSAAARAAEVTQARYASAGWEVLTEVERHDRKVAAQVMRYPAVGAWAVSTLSALGTGYGAPAAVPARLAAVAAAAAVRSGVDAEVPVLPVDGVVSLPSLGVAQVGDSAVVRSYPGHAEIRWARGRLEIPVDRHSDAPGWLGLRGCQTGKLHTVIDDLDPFRMPAAPDLAARLTAAEAREWQQSLQLGWQVLVEASPAAAAEVAAAISVIVPLRKSAHGHLSSSSPQTFGAMAMSEPSDPDTCASTLVHEVQHVKLCAVLDIVRMTLPDDGSRYYAPWRGDPRPIAGLLQGAYAYLGVTEFWRRRREFAVGAAQLRADGEFALWRTGTARAIGVLLSSNRLTTVGAAFVRRMSETADQWMSEPVSAEARASALHDSRDHLAHWELSNGPAPRPE